MLVGSILGQSMLSARYIANILKPNSIPSQYNMSIEALSTHRPTTAPHRPATTSRRHSGNGFTVKKVYLYGQQVLKLIIVLTLDALPD